MGLNDGRWGVAGVGAMLALAGVASISAALWLTTDAFHTRLFAGLGFICLTAAAILFWKSATAS